MTPVAVAGVTPRAPVAYNNRFTSPKSRLMILRMKKLAHCLGFVLIALCVHAPALAALPDKPQSINNADKPYVAYAVAFVLIAGVCVAVFKSSKRTHLD